MVGLSETGQGHFYTLRGQVCSCSIADSWQHIWASNWVGEMSDVIVVTTLDTGTCSICAAMYAFVVPAIGLVVDLPSLAEVFGYNLWRRAALLCQC